MEMSIFRLRIELNYDLLYNMCILYKVHNLNGVYEFQCINILNGLKYSGVCAHLNITPYMFLSRSFNDLYFTFTLQ